MTEPQRVVRPPVRRTVFIRRAIAAVAAIAALISFWQFLFDGNFGVVDPGLVYRSAQPRKNFDALIRDHQLKSVLNLRGGTEADSWYLDEIRTSRARNVAFYDLPLSAVRRPKRSQLLTLIEVLDRCEYPLLIHCKWGSDRTGLASGVYLMLKRGKPPTEAARMFSVTHGHLPFLGPESLHAPFDEYAAWLEAHHENHSPEQFRDWVAQIYQDEP